MNFLFFRVRKARQDRTSFFVTLPWEYAKSLDIKSNDYLDMALHLKSGLLLLYPRKRLAGGFDSLRLFEEFLEWKANKENAAFKDSLRNNPENPVAERGNGGGSQ